MSPDGSETPKWAPQLGHAMARREGLRLLACALALAWLCASPALAQSAIRVPFGTMVRAGDFDAAPGPLRALPQAQACLGDANGNGTLDGGETLYLAPGGCDKNATGSLRFAGAGAGSRILSGDTDRGRGRTPWPEASFAFADLNRDGQWSAGDALYLLRAPAGTVAAGDVRFLAPGNVSASAVRAGDPDVGRAVGTQPSSGAFRAAFHEAVRAWDVDGDGAGDADDVLYLDLDGTTSPTVQDVRLAALGPRPYAAALVPGDPDAASALLSFGPAAALCAFDRDASGAPSPGEPVYFRYAGCATRPAPLAPADVRLSGPTAGSKVAAGDGDEGAPSVPFGAGAVRFADLNRDARWSEGDVLYAHAAAGRTTVSEGDLRLTRFGSLAGGSLVAAGDSDLKFLTTDVSAGQPLAADPGTAWRFWDGDGNLRFDGPLDLLYIDLDGNGRVDLLDVRLGPMGGAPFGVPVRPGDPDARGVLEAGVAAASVCHADPDRDRALDRGEAMAWQARPCDAPAAGDLRLTGPQAGARLRRGDAELNGTAAWLPVPSAVRFYDADGSGTWSAADTAYLHVAFGRAEVAPGDLRLSAYGSRLGGTAVGPDEDDVGLPTLPFAAGLAAPAGWRWWDLDGDGRFGTDDALYLDADASGTVTTLDLRLSEVRRNLTEPTLGVDQIPELLRTIETLERLLGEQADRAGDLAESVQAQNATLEELRANLSRLEAENAALRQAEEAKVPPQTAPTPAPGALAVASVLAVLALRRRRAPPAADAPACTKP